MSRTFIIFAVICSLLLLFGPLVPYFIVFHSAFSNIVQDWAAFGNYLTGISSLLNVIVLISITVLLHNIDATNRNNELKFTQRKEIFSRFLSAYEKLIVDLYSLKALLALNSKNPANLELKKLLDIHISIKTLKNYANVYIDEPIMSIPQNDGSAQKITTILDSFLDDELYALISILEVSDHNLLPSKIKETNSKIETLITSIGEIARKCIYHRSNGL
jgi:hypothetical protein